MSTQGLAEISDEETKDASKQVGHGDLRCGLPGVRL